MVIPWDEDSNYDEEDGSEDSSWEAVKQEEEEDDDDPFLEGGGGGGDDDDDLEEGDNDDLEEEGEDDALEEEEEAAEEEEDDSEDEEEEEEEEEEASGSAKEIKGPHTVCKPSVHEAGFKGVTSIGIRMKPSHLCKAPGISVQETTDVAALEITSTEEEGDVIEAEHSNTEASLDDISSGMPDSFQMTETSQETADASLSGTSGLFFVGMIPVTSTAKQTSDRQRNAQEYSPAEPRMARVIKDGSPVRMELQGTERSLVGDLQRREDLAVVDQTTFAVVNALEIIGDQARWSSLLPAVKASKSEVNLPSLHRAHRGLRKTALRGILDTITSVAPSEMYSVMPHVATLAGLFGAGNYDWSATRSALVGIIDRQQARCILSMRVKNIQANSLDLGQIKSHQDSLEYVRSQLENTKNATRHLQVERRQIETSMEELRSRLAAMDRLENVCQAYLGLMAKEEQRIASVVEAETETHRSFEARLRSVESQLYSLQADFESDVAGLSALS